MAELARLMEVPSLTTHVPCLFYGNGIEQGVSTDRAYTRDIAPTISSLLSIPTLTVHWLPYLRCSVKIIQTDGHDFD